MQTNTLIMAISWISERLRDFMMWPLNLVRDFPVRSGRLFHTYRRGLRGIQRLLPEAQQAMRQGKLLWWVRRRGGQGAGWLHLFVVQLFDLLGGPELLQFLAHFFTVTMPLTAEERQMMVSILGPEGMRYRDVRVAQGGVLDLVFKYNGNLAFATWYTINLPRNGRHTRPNLPLVIHELTHVYQYHCVGSRYLGEAIYKLITTKRDCYDYGGTAGLKAARAAGKRFVDFNREQQATIVQDYYTLREQGADVAAYAPFIFQLRAGEL